MTDYGDSRREHVTAEDRLMELKKEESHTKGDKGCS